MTLYLLNQIHRLMMNLFIRIGSYYKSLGVTNDNWNQNSDTYTKLGLAQLGFPDIDSYNKSELKKNADKLVNADGVKSQVKMFPNNWIPITRKAPMNFSQSFSIGDQISCLENLLVTSPVFAILDQSSMTLVLISLFP